MQFAHIARPIVLLEIAHADGGNPNHLDAVLAREAFAELVGQNRYIFPSLPEGRDDYGDNIQPEEKILTELFSLDALLEMPIRGGDHSHVHFDGAVSAHPFQFTLLQHAQKLCLHLGRNLADLIQ